MTDRKYKESTAAKDDIEKGPLLEAEEHKAPVAPEPRRAILGVPVQVIAGACYCTASASMVLLNKAALSSFDFHSPNSLLFSQCALCVVLVQLCAWAGVVKLEPWNNKIVQVWLPVNVIFVGMIATSFFALKDLGVPMATVLKNLTNLLTITGDYFLYGKTYNAGVWASLGLMIVSALCGAFTDLAFSLSGYLWQLVNCVFTAGYSLHLRGVMDKVVTLTVSRSRLDEFSMVFYNNLLSLPFILALMILSGEAATVASEPALQNPNFILAASVSAVLAFGISFASLWFLSSTTATVFSLVGSLNKVPVAIIGLVAFNVPYSAQNVASILVGLVAGIVFVKAKQAR